MRQAAASKRGRLGAGAKALSAMSAAAHGIVAEPSRRRASADSSDAAHCSVVQLGFEYENARSEGRRARFFGAQADLRTGWTARARSPRTGDGGALIYGRCSMSNQMSEYPHYIEGP